MKLFQAFPFSLILLLSILCAKAQNQDSSWTQELRMEQVKNLHDSSTWDMSRMKKDNKPQPMGNPGFMKFGAFPVSEYNLIGEQSFKGVGNFSRGFQPIELKDKKVVYTSFLVNESPFYDTENEKDRVFFTIVTVTDTVDLKNYSTHRLQILSRNHPDYVGQGYIKTKESTIDFLAFITPEGHEYAVVNMRLFHLNYGNVIIIAPHKDGSFRSLQLDEKELNSGILDDFIQNELLKRENIIKFLTHEKVI